MDKQNRAVGFTFRVHSSRMNIIWMITVHMLAILMIVISALPAMIKITGCVVLILTHYLLRADSIISQSRWEQIRYSQKYGWEIKRENVWFQAVEILPSTWISMWLVLIHFQYENRSYVWPIFLDAMRQDEFRCLRVYLQTVGFNGT